MLAQLFTPAYLPFATAFIVMVGIGIIEAIGLGVGHLDLETEVGADADGSFLDWLGLGDDIPVLIWLTSLLACFTVTGVAIQQACTALTGAPLQWALAAGGALLAGGVLNGFVSHGLARVMPGYESTIVSTDQLLRRRGTVMEGTARRGVPARAKVTDHHGQAHFVMVEPHEDSDAIAAGETALLVRREGQIFFALPDRHTLLQSI